MPPSNTCVIVTKKIFKPQNTKTRSHLIGSVHEVPLGLSKHYKKDFYF